MRVLTQGSLFTGILGFEEGFGEHFEPRWCAEVDKFCNKIIALRAPGVPNLGDVTAVQRPESVDVISFGSPCQDLSVAGRRAGLDGARSGLFFEAARIINQCRPSFAVWENVPGAFSSDTGRDFWMVLYTLRELGAHDVAWRVFDSQYAGVPQQRRRIYLVADFRGRRAGEILFDPEGCGGHPSPFGEAREGLARSLTRGSSNAGVNEPGRHHEDDFNLVTAAMTSKWATGSGGPSGDEIQNLTLAKPLTAREGKGVDSLLTNGNIFVVQTYGSAIRRFTPLECERLQGFPDGWTCLCLPLEAWAEAPAWAMERCKCPDGPRYRALGNAVTATVPRWLASRIAACF